MFFLEVWAPLLGMEEAQGKEGGSCLCCICYRAGAWNQEGWPVGKWVSSCSLEDAGRGSAVTGECPPFFLVPLLGTEGEKGSPCPAIRFQVGMLMHCHEASGKAHLRVRQRPHPTSSCLTITED